MFLHIRPYMYLIAIMIISFYLGSRGLGNDVLFGVEYYTALHAGAFDSVVSVEKTLESVATVTPDHAPLYFVFVHFWVRLVSVHPIALRAFSLLLLPVAIAISFKTGSRLLGWHGGLLTACFVAFSALLRFYSHEARMYVFVPLVAMAILHFYWSIVSAKDGVAWQNWFGLFLASLGGIYLHYSSLFILASVAAYHCLIAKKNRRWLKVVAVECLAGLLFLPWLHIALDGIARHRSLDRWSLSISETLYHILFAHTHGLWHVAAALGLLALLTVSDRNSSRRFVLFVSIFGLLAMLIVNEYVTTVVIVRRIRYALVLLPLLSLLFSLGLLKLVANRRRLLDLLVLIVTVVWVIASLRFYESTEMSVYTNRAAWNFQEYPPFHRVQAILDDLPGFGEPVLSAHPTVDVELPVLLFYANWTGRQFNHVFNETDPYWKSRMIERLYIFDDDESFLLVYDPRATNPEDIHLYDSIAADFRSCRILHGSSDLRVDYYVRYHIPCSLFEGDLPMELVFENGMLLHNLILEELGNAQFRVYSWWDRGDLPVSAQLGFDLRVSDDEGRAVWNKTYYMPTRTIGYNDMDLSELAPGRYFLDVSVWNAETGNPVRVGARVEGTVDRELWRAADFLIK